MTHRARKRFGQNFLHDRNVIDRIISAVDPRPGERVVEIGPGQAALTRHLLASGAELTVIEIDRDLVGMLENDPQLAGLTIVTADALKVDLRTLAGESRLRLVGNLPYNVSTPLLFHALEAVDRIADMHFMLQKEVVDRMAASPGSKVYGRLSVMLQYHCRVEPLFVVKPGSFTPQPRVNSAVVRLVPVHRTTAADDPAALLRVVTAAFSKRRKTLANALKGLVDAGQLDRLGVDPGTRAEQVSVEAFVAIANSLSGLR